MRPVAGGADLARQRIAPPAVNPALAPARGGGAAVAVFRAYAALPVAAQGPIGPVLQAAAAAAEQAREEGAAAADARQSAHRLRTAGAACAYCHLVNPGGAVHGDGGCRSLWGRCLRCFARNHSARQCQLDTAVINRCRQCALPGWVADVQLHPGTSPRPPARPRPARTDTPSVRSGLADRVAVTRCDLPKPAETTDEMGRAVRTFGTAACPMVAVKEVLLMAWTVRGARPGIPLRRGCGTYGAGVLWPTASSAQTRRAEVDAALAAEGVQLAPNATAQAFFDAAFERGAQPTAQLLALRLFNRLVAQLRL